MKFEFNNGIYDGEVNEQGLPHGSGIFTKSGKFVYEGSFVDGQFNGYGVLAVLDAKAFEETFVAEKFDAIDTLGVGAPSSYEGNFLNGLIDGMGRLTFECGSVYEGGFVQGRFDGMGRLSYEGGALYEGSFSCGCFHGLGRYIDADGKVFLGMFDHGKYDPAENLFDPDPNSRQSQPSSSSDDSVQDEEAIEDSYELGENDHIIHESDFTYIGEVNEDGLPQGHGKAIFTDGGYYEGDWINGSPCGQGKTVDENGICHEGGYLDGLYHGYGEITYPDGKVVCAIWENDVLVELCEDSRSKVSSESSHIGADDVPNDSARCEGDDEKGSFHSMKYPNGDLYEGDIENGLPHGSGRLTRADGDVYEGEFKNGVFDGNGKYYFNDGATLEGEWTDGLVNGMARFVAYDGTAYIGEYFEGEWNGKGELYFQDGRRYVGIFEDGGLISGTCYLTDGSIYEGEFKDFSYDGHGKMTYANGDLYEGDWKNDKPHGRGIKYYADKRVYKGSWKNGEWHGKGVLFDGDIILSAYWLGIGVSNNVTRCEGEAITYGSMQDGVFVKNDLVPITKYYLPKGRKAPVRPDCVTSEACPQGDFDTLEQTPSTSEAEKSAPESDAPQEAPSTSEAEESAPESDTPAFSFKVKQVELNGEYEGQTNTRGVPHGQGKMTYKSGSIYEGGWFIGEWYGNGRLTLVSGVYYDGVFEETGWSNDITEHKDNTSLHGKMRNGSFIED